MEDAFFEHNTDSRPVDEEKGALIVFRDGRRAIVPPLNDTNRLGQSDNLWFRLGEEDEEEGDVLSFRPIEAQPSEWLLWKVLKFLNAIEAERSDPLREHPFSKMTMLERETDLRGLIEDYLQNWPHQPEYAGVRRIDRWLEIPPDEDDDYDLDEDWDEDHDDNS